MRWQRSLSEARHRDHQARARTDRRLTELNGSAEMPSRPLRRHDTGDVKNLSGEPAMAEETTRSRLGRGLASLIGDMGAEANNAAPNATTSERVRGQRRVPIEFL